MHIPALLGLSAAGLGGATDDDKADEELPGTAPRRSRSGSARKPRLKRASESHDCVPPPGRGEAKPSTPWPWTQHAESPRGTATSPAEDVDTSEPGRSSDADTGRGTDESDPDLSEGPLTAPSAAGVPGWDSTSRL